MFTFRTYNKFAVLCSDCKIVLDRCYCIDCNAPSIVTRKHHDAFSYLSTPVNRKCALFLVQSAESGYVTKNIPTTI